MGAKDGAGMALGAGDAAGYDLWCWARGGMFCELPNGEM
jgi:hypothetical protein